MPHARRVQISERARGVGVKREATLQAIDIGKGEVLREGEDVLILAIGSTVYPSLRAAEKLAEAGIHAAVINSRFLKPLDANLLCDWAKRAGKSLRLRRMFSREGLEVLCWSFFRREDCLPFK